VTPPTTLVTPPVTPRRRCNGLVGLGDADGPAAFVVEVERTVLLGLRGLGLWSASASFVLLTTLASLPYPTTSAY